MAELNKLFLTDRISIDGTTGTFAGHTGITDLDSIQINPLQAIISPPTDHVDEVSSNTVEVGIGFALSQEPRDYIDGIGQPILVPSGRRYNMDVTVLVRGTMDNAYTVLLTAGEFLLSLGGRTGEIGGYVDPTDRTSDQYETDVVLIEDGGEITQSIDEQDNYVLTRNFGILTN